MFWSIVLFVITADHAITLVRADSGFVRPFGSRFGGTSSSLSMGRILGSPGPSGLELDLERPSLGLAPSARVDPHIESRRDSLGSSVLEALSGQSRQSDSQSSGNGGGSYKVRCRNQTGCLPGLSPQQQLGKQKLPVMIKILRLMQKELKLKVNTEYF